MSNPNPNPDLPEDHIVEIPARLPVESLLRCKSVCKPWRSRISNPSFIKMHMDRTMMNPINKTFITHSFETHSLHPYIIHCFNCLTDSGSHILSLINSNSLNKAVKLNIPFPTSTNKKGFIVVGSCNGLLCIANEPDELYLWNPATRQLKDIKKYTIKVEDVDDHISLGFGFDHGSGDYKVVRIVTDLHRFPSISRVEVYSLYENSWKEIETELRFKIIRPFCNAIVKGLPYWLAEDISVPKRFILVSFDVLGEKFCKISLPDDIVDPGSQIGVSEYMESVAIITCNKYPDIDIWALDNDSRGRSCWIKKLNFAVTPLINGLVGCLKTGDFLAQTFTNDLVLYDPKNSLVKPTHIQMLTFRVHNYIESLVSLN